MRNKIAVLGALLSLTACDQAPNAASTMPPAPSPPPVTMTSASAAASAPLTSTAATQAATATPPRHVDDLLPHLECRAKSGDQTFELALAWSNNVSHGTLQTSRTAAAAKSQPVDAELYKGLILVRPAGAAPNSTAIATIDTNSGPKKMQVGDFKQAWLPCE